MVCQAVLEAIYSYSTYTHKSISITAISLFSKAEVNSSHPITQEKPLNICFCCHGNCLLLPLLLPDRWKKEKEKQSESKSFSSLQVHFNVF